MAQSVIKDPIWGEIQFFPWEKTLLNTSAFNRLHNVLQNSNAYKVYPSARHSRFVHSVGVMQIATRICLSVYSNSNLDKRIFEKEYSFEQLQIKQEIDEISAVFANKGGDINLILNSIINERFGFACDSNNLASLCVVRVAALLHDIGHLPYSHIFENALGFWLNSDGNPKFKDKLEKGIAIHERVGAWLMKYLEKSDPHTSKDENLRVFIKIASDLLHGKRFPIHKTMISGVIDADRIDYVRRDCEVSGFIKSSVDYDRLFRNFEVSSSLDRLISNERSCFVRPGKKAQSDLEKVLWERYQEYMYVVGHHKVSFFDEITKRIIVELLRLGRLNHVIDALDNLSNYFSAPDGPDTTHSQFDTPKKISEFLLYNCDDGILDHEIKKLFQDVYNDKIDYKEDSEFKLRRLKALVTAHCEKRDYFKTVFKDDESFWNWISSAGNSIHNRWSKYPVDIDILSAEISSNVERIERAVFDDTGTRGSIIIIGGAHGKLKSGLANLNTVKLFSLSGLSEFIESKRDAMRAFNLWCCKDSDFQESEILAVIAKNLEILPEAKINKNKISKSS